MIVTAINKKRPFLKCTLYKLYTQAIQFSEQKDNRKLLRDNGFSAQKRTAGSKEETRFVTQSSWVSLMASWEA